MKKDDKDKIFKIIQFIIIIILIIIILLLLFGKKEELQVPTGNVDIFEINCNSDCDCNTDTDTDNDTNTENNNDNNSTGYKNNSTDIPAISQNDDTKSDIVITNDDKVWVSSNKINMFENPTYEMKAKISPEDSNSYQFVVHNNTTYDVTYDLTFSEVNNYQINMKYRLKKNGEYIAGSEDSWISYSELSKTNFDLSAKSNDTYTLDWKWFESSNDTEIGTTLDASYELDLKITAVQRFS